MSESETVDAVFALRRLMEKFRSKSKKLFYVFVALEKAFDWVPQKVIWYALRKKGVPEYLDHSIVSLCSVCNNWGLRKISVKPIAICYCYVDVLAEEMWGVASCWNCMLMILFSVVNL